MILFSTFTIAAIAVLGFLALLGFVFYLAAKNGWTRNGYFRIPAVILIVFGLFLAFQALGNGITLGVVGIHIEHHPLAALSINGLAEIVVMIGGAALISKGSGQNLRAIFRLEGISETPAAPYLLAVPIILAAQYAGEAVSAVWERGWELFPFFYHIINQYETASDKAMQGLVTATGPLEPYAHPSFRRHRPGLSGGDDVSRLCAIEHRAQRPMACTARDCTAGGFVPFCTRSRKFV